MVHVAYDRCFNYCTIYFIAQMYFVEMMFLGEIEAVVLSNMQVIYSYL